MTEKALVKDVLSASFVRCFHSVVIRDTKCFVLKAVPVSQGFLSLSTYFDFPVASITFSSSGFFYIDIE